MKQLIAKKFRYTDFHVYQIRLHKLILENCAYYIRYNDMYFKLVISGYIVELKTNYFTSHFKAKSRIT